MLLLATSDRTEAQNFVHEFSSPSFGGHPNNASWILNITETQKESWYTRDEDEAARFRRDPLADFGQNLQRQMLSQLSRELVRGELSEIDLSEEGRFDLGDFVIEVTPGLDMINIEVRDQISGESTQVEIPRF